MRPNYPVISAELNDLFQDLYYKLTWILGYDDDNGNTTYQGQFDLIENRLREAIYISLLQLNNTQDSLVFNEGTTYEVEVYSTWGRNIIINELRSM